MTRRLLTEEEYHSLPNISPTGAETDLDRKEIYRMSESGKVRDRTGEEIDVPCSWFVKVLSTACAERWCYEVVRLAVVRAGHRVELRPGIPVAFLPPEVVPTSEASHDPPPASRGDRSGNGRSPGTGVDLPSAE